MCCIRRVKLKEATSQRQAKFINYSQRNEYPQISSLQLFKRIYIFSGEQKKLHLFFNCLTCLSSFDL